MGQTDPSESVKPQRAYQSGVNLSIMTLLNVVVDLVPIRQADKSIKFKTVCPTCDDVTSLEQRYLCPTDTAHGPFVVSEAGRAKEIDGILYKVSEEEIAEVKDPSLPDGECAITVFDAAEITAATRIGESAYRLRPKGQLPLYAMLLDLVSDSSKAFVGELSVRKTQKMFQLTAWRGQLVLQELVRPDDLAPTDSLSLPPYDPRLLDRATELATNNIEPFDAAKFRNEVRERARKLDEAKRDPNATPAPKPKKGKAAESTDDLLAALEASLAKNTKAS